MDKKVLIVCPPIYNGKELWTALDEIDLRDIEFEVSAITSVIVEEVSRESNKVTPFAALPPVEEYDGILFTAGEYGCVQDYWEEPEVLALVEQAVDAEIPIAAICISVPIIRTAAKDRAVSYFPLRSADKLLDRAGVLRSNMSITVDGPIVTAEFSMHARKWAGYFCDLVKGDVPDSDFQESGFKSEKIMSARNPKARRDASSESASNPDSGNADPS